LGAGYKAVKAVASMAKVIEKAQGLLRRVEKIAARAQEIAVAALRKLGGKSESAGGSCLLHSFVAGTLVLMADGSSKPIDEIRVGDKVKAADPVSGETSDREVVGTIVHTDEGDMTRVTVDGGTVDATSWHPVWVEERGDFAKIGTLKPGEHLRSPGGLRPVVTDVQRYAYVQPVYDLTIDGVHTYHVVVGTVPVLVHNCPTGGARFEVDSNGVATDLDQNPLDGTRYTDKVLEQIKSGDDHAFPALIDTIPTMRDTSMVAGGDGIVRMHVKLPGKIGGSAGTFHWIIEPDGSINHRFFDRRMR
jgi:hypothetical protein